MREEPRHGGGKEGGKEEEKEGRNGGRGHFDQKT